MTTIRSPNAEVSQCHLPTPFCLLSETLPSSCVAAMMCASAPTVLLLLLVVWPVTTLCLPYNWTLQVQLERTMNALSEKTVCPFIGQNTSTGGIPEIVPEYRCKLNNASEKVDNSLGRCMSVRECIQGTTTIMIQMSDRKVARTFKTGCFCASQTASSPRSQPLPPVDNHVS